jgi:hypothetical protein
LTTPGEPRYRELHAQFVNSAAGRAAKQKAIIAQYDWRNDPRFDEWIWKAWDEIGWVEADEFEREEREAFSFWARSTNAFKGICY